MSYVNFNRALTKAQIEALGEAGTAVNGKIYFATDDGIYVGNADGSVSLKANAGGDITSEPLGPIDDPTNAYYTRTQTDTLLLGKQDTLVSGTNIKTINNNSLLGSGNITIDPNNTFIARYNVTSFADVKAAYLAGKTVVCLYWSIASGDGEDIYLTLYNYYTDDGPGHEYFTFTGIYINNSYVIYLNEDGDSWDVEINSLVCQYELSSKVPYHNTNYQSVKLYGGYPIGYGSLTLYGGRATSGGSLTMGYASNNTNTTNNSIQANGRGSFAGGYSTQNAGIVANSSGSIAFGYNNTSDTKILANNNGATAMGVTSILYDGTTYSGNLDASGEGSHAEGCASRTEGVASHVEGVLTYADAVAAHAEGFGTVASNDAEHAEGKWNVSNANTISSIGIGTADNDRKNAFEVKSTGAVYIKGVGTYDGTNPVSGTNDIKTIINQKQEVLISGTNIKTINGSSLLGSGNINLGERYLEIWDNDKIMNFSSNISITTPSLLNTEPFKTLYNNLLNFRNGVYSGLRVYRYTDHGSSGKEITETLTMTLLGCNYDDDDWDGGRTFESLYFEGAYLSDADNMVLSKRILKLATNTYDDKYLGSIFSLKTETPQTASTMILTQAQYDALTTKDPNTLYIIKTN